jgi:uncharacterized membrane protein YfcA
LTEPVSILVLLAAFGLAAGVGITAVGPGGVLATVGLFLCTDLPPAAVAGTAIVTNVATGLAGSFAYHRSGHLAEPDTARTARLLAGTAVVGTPAGVLVNSVVPGRLFGVLLASLVVLVALLVWFRERNATGHDDRRPRLPTALLVGGGLAVAVVSGMFGVGGPLLTVPLLVAAGTPMLSAVAASQVQSVVISTVGAAGYLSQGSIDWPLAAVVGVPELCGVLIGWQLARRIPDRHLKRAMIAALLAVAPLLALHG